MPIEYNFHAYRVLLSFPYCSTFMPSFFESAGIVMLRTTLLLIEQPYTLLIYREIKFDYWNNFLDKFANSGIYS